MAELLTELRPLSPDMLIEARLVELESMGYVQLHGHRRRQCCHSAARFSQPSRRFSRDVERARVD